jgi:hypothetical protein
VIEREDRAVFAQELQRRRRGRGRPRSAAPKVRITVDLPEDVFDALCRDAVLRRTSLHALLRETLSTRVR